MLRSFHIFRQAEKQSAEQQYWTMKGEKNKSFG
jgi:hypothetical protein